jgi:hypothetical protein
LKVSGLGVAEALTGEVVPQNTDDLTHLQRDDVVRGVCSDGDAAVECC